LVKNGSETLPEPADEDVCATVRARWEDQSFLQIHRERLERDPLF
jgi:hypothetical protein